MTNEKPILFSSEMVKAILEGRKTQTRRVISKRVKNGGEWFTSIPTSFQTPDRIVKHWPCPYGQVGTQLWVKETHYLFGKWVKNGLTKTGKQKWAFKPIGRQVKYLDNPPDVVERSKDRVGWFKRPSIFMPRWASRITLEITDIRVQHLQDITDDDAFEEGMTQHLAAMLGLGGEALQSEEEFNFTQTRRVFRNLWDSINAKRGYGWDMNPWVWVIKFRRVECE